MNGSRQLVDTLVTALNEAKWSENVGKYHQYWRVAFHLRPHASIIAMTIYGPDSISISISRKQSSRAINRSSAFHGSSFFIDHHLPKIMQI
jgi:predicted S18 family serine protease